jgi:hypothetical protein
MLNKKISVELFNWKFIWYSLLSKIKLNSSECNERRSQVDFVITESSGKNRGFEIYLIRSIVFSMFDSEEELNKRSSQKV